MAFEGLTEKLNATFKRLRGKGRLSENDVREAMREVRLALLEADVSYKVVKEFVANVTERAVGADVLDSLTPAQQVIKIVNEELTKLMGGGTAKLVHGQQRPHRRDDGGPPGRRQDHHHRQAGGADAPAAGQAAAAGGLRRVPPRRHRTAEGGGRASWTCRYSRRARGTRCRSPQDAIRHARDHGSDMVFLDTAGRLHVDEALMDELKRMKSAVHPNEILLVVDAMTGQDAVNAASAFDEALGIDGVVLTKLDGDARGGAALSIRAVHRKAHQVRGHRRKAGHDRALPSGPDGLPDPGHGRHAVLH